MPVWSISNLCPLLVAGALPYMVRVSYWGGDCILCTKQVVNSGHVVVMGDFRLMGGGLLRWQGESVSLTCIL